MSTHSSFPSAQPSFVKLVKESLRKNDRQALRTENIAFDQTTHVGGKIRKAIRRNIYLLPLKYRQ